MKYSNQKHINRDLSFQSNDSSTEGKKVHFSETVPNEEEIEIRLGGSIKIDESLKSESSPLKNITELSMSKEDDPLGMSFSERNFDPAGRYEPFSGKHNKVRRNKKGETEFDKY